MSVYNLPLEINYQKFETSNFAGSNYLSGFPSIAAALAAQSYSATFSDARAVYVADPTYPRKDFVWMFKGLQCIYLAPGKAFGPGCDVRIYNKASAGATHGVVAARVESYDAITGLMWFDAYAISLGLDTGSPETNHIPITNTRVTAFNGKNVAVVGNRTIATGGTGATSDMDALNNFGSRNGRDVVEYLHDFLSPAEGPAHVFGTTGTYLNAYGVAQSDPTNHPGVIQLGAVTTVASNRSKTLILANHARAPSSSYSGGITVMNAGCAVEWLVWQPALSNVTNEYTYVTGLYFINTSNIETYLQFAYTRTSSVNWKIQGRALNGSVTDTATATAVASAWIKFRIEFDGTTFTFRINGTSVGTMTAASLGYVVGINTPLYFRSSITWVAGTSPIYDHDYVYIKKVFLGPRTG